MTPTKPQPDWAGSVFTLTGGGDTDMQIMTGTNTTTVVIHCHQIKWRGRLLFLQIQPSNLFPILCEDGQHKIEEMDHYGMPTGFLWCPECGGTAHDPT